MRKADYFEQLDENRVKCFLCPHNCMVKEGHAGICGVRKNIKGELISEIYGRISAIAMDPVEKKPLYHFYPGTNILSIGSKGCNLKCPFCQNWHISQDLSAKTAYYEPGQIADLAVQNNSIGIAYTYNEPIIWAEFVIDTARLARERELVNVMVTNGFVNKGPLDDFLEYVDAFNVDLKSFNEETYKKYMKANLNDVRDVIEIINKSGRHLELTTLIVTGINDTIEEMRQIIDFIASLDKNIPWHISRYHPGYKYEEKATDVDFIYSVHEEASKRLNFVYCGNIHSSRGSDTACPQCGSVVIKRSGYFTQVKNLDGMKCMKCGSTLPIILN